jgi:hypothetical protein
MPFTRLNFLTCKVEGARLDVRRLASRLELNRDFHMKNFLSLAILAFLTQVASAAPYLLYSGTIKGSNVSASGSTTANTLVYLLTDLADTSEFAVLLVDGASGQYSVLARPSDSATAEEANNNFLASTGNSAVFCYSGEVTDANNVTTVIRGYGSGALTTRNTVLAAPRRTPLVVRLKTNRVPVGTYTFPVAATAVATGSAPFTKSITGFASGYVLSSAGDLANATTPGALNLTLNPALTADANIGGGYAPNTSNEAAIMPVSVTSVTSAADAFAAWIAAFAQASGYTSASAASNASTALSYSGSTAIGGTSIGINGILDSNNAVSVAVGSGELTLAYIRQGINPEIGALTLSSSSAFSGVLALGGLIPSSDSSYTVGTLTISDPDNSGADLFLNIGSNLGVYSGGGILPAPGQSRQFNDTLFFPIATITLNTVNPDYTVTCTISGISGAMGTSLSATDATFTIGGLGVSQILGINNPNTMHSYTNEMLIQGGTVTNTNGSYSFSGSSVTIPGSSDGDGGGIIIVATKAKPQ